MKLTTLQIALAEDQLPAAAISESASETAQLRDLFGDHTFFVDPDGLQVLERFDEDQPEDGREALTAVQLASWTDETKQSVSMHEPVKTDKLVFLVGGSGGLAG